MLAADSRAAVDDTGCNHHDQGMSTSQLSRGQSQLDPDLASRLFVQLEAALEASKRLHERINVHRATVRRLGEHPTQPTKRHPTMSNSDGAVTPPPLTSSLHPQQTQDHFLSSPGAPPLILHPPQATSTPADSTSTPISAWRHQPTSTAVKDTPELAQRRWAVFSELETKHHAALEAQHEEALLRREQLHMMKVARLEAQLLDQEARCAEQAARADALAEALGRATQLLKRGSAGGVSTGSAGGGGHTHMHLAHPHHQSHSIGPRSDSGSQKE